MYSENSGNSAFKEAEKRARSEHWEEGLRRFDSPGTYTFPERPGLVLLKGFLSIEKQTDLINLALTEYLSPPYRTNLGDPVPDLYYSHPDLMKRVTWSTLGYQYNWTERSYPDSWVTPVPPSIFTYSHEIASFLGVEIRPEAVIVNFYHTKMRLGGHLDSIEPNQEIPLISIRCEIDSLGLGCVFLMGGITKEEEPLALHLTSGDVVMMGGQSRRCYHGVPRILPLPVPVFNCPHDPYISSHRININIRQVI